MASTTDPTEKAAYIAGLRALADAMESTPIPLPLMGHTTSYYPDSADEYRALVAVVANLREHESSAGRSAEYPVRLTGDIGGARVDIGISASLADEIFTRRTVQPVYEYDLTSVVAS